MKTGAAHTHARSRKRKQPEDTHTGTHCDTGDRGGLQHTRFTSPQPPKGKLEVWDEDLVRPGGETGHAACPGTEKQL